MDNPFSMGRALVIGIANYPNVRRLPEAVLNDAREVAKLLQSPEYCGYPDTQVKILDDEKANKEAILTEFKELAKRAQRDDTVLIFFSGHGGRKTEGPDLGNYLIPYNCNPSQLKDTAIERSELTELLSTIKSKRLVLLLDACHSGGTGDLKEVLDVGEGIKAGFGAEVYNELGKGAGRVVMASSREDEFSYISPGANHSLFTQHLLDALKGKAAIPDETVVRVFPVFRFVSDAVPAANGNQHPIFKADNLEDDFALALNQGGKTATIPTPATSRPRRERLSHQARFELSRRLLDGRWERLAVWLGVPIEERVRFQQGREPIQLLDWLDLQRKLGDLRSIFVLLGWDDLVKVIDDRPTLPRR